MNIDSASPPRSLRRICVPLSWAMLLWLLLLPAAVRLCAQTGAVRPWLYFPAPRGAGDVRTMVGVRLLTLPREIVEEEINKAPALDGAVAIGLRGQTALHAQAILQYVTNHIRVGGKWTHRLGNFGIGAGYDIGIWFGFADFEGFDNRGNGWTHYPQLLFGYDFGDVLLSLRGEVIWIQAMRTFVGENEIRSTGNRIAGGSLMAVLEQPFWGNTHAALGVRLSLTEFHYQSWFAFSTFERKLLFSELILGILL
ncbi:MAG: hypothetical protein RRA94_00495 [Bacteroidota bacterium]|nr:hypothetical protein [Bacteroidota bacterium]